MFIIACTVVMLYGNRKKSSYVYILDYQIQWYYFCPKKIKTLTLLNKSVMRKFIAVIITLLFVLPLVLMATEQSNAKSDVSIVLMGTVVEIPNNTPIEDVVVELVDTETEETRTDVTLIDGIYSFSLEPDKIYRLLVSDNEGNALDVKSINTIGINEPQILHSLLEMSTQQITVAQKGNTVNFGVIKQEQYANPNYGNKP